MSEDQKFLESILQSIALHPQNISTTRVIDDRGVLIRIQAAKPDMPRLIGKGGRNISALRLVMKLFAKDGQNISLMLDEPAEGGAGGYHARFVSVPNNIRVCGTDGLGT